MVSLVEFLAWREHFAIKAAQLTEGMAGSPMEERMRRSETIAMDATLEVDDVLETLARIEFAKDDDEVAHGIEDDMRHAVLLAIAAGHEHPAALALAALKSSDIEFARWCA